MSDIQDRLQALFPVHYRSGNVLLINANCMEVMKHIRDGEFELSCVDPPYGIGFDGEVEAMANNNSVKWTQAVGAGYDRKEWDAAPSSEYFEELRRVSKDQIIWGGNYFDLPQSSGWIFWEKGTAEGFTLSPGELAWTSYQNSVKRVAMLWAGFRKCEQGQRIHPTQKPVKLYEWLLTNYAKPGQRILDTHGGSMSSAIACYNLGYSLTLCELDEDYYKSGVARFEQHKAQGSLFMPDTVRDVYEQTDFLEGATE